MDRDALRAYARRDWAVLERLDRAHWADTIAGQDPNAGFRAAGALAEHARRVRPDWPTAADRQRDLDHHIALKRRMDHAASALTRR